MRKSNFDSGPNKNKKREGLSLSLRLVLSLLCAVGLVTRDLLSLLLGISLSLLSLLLAGELVGLSLAVAVVGVAIARAGGYLHGDYHEVVLAIGTGAGFPGLALKIARPDLNVTLLDSTEKKLKVVRDIAEKLGFTTDEQCPADEFGIPYYDMDKEAVHIIHARAEEAGQQKEFRERFDYVTSRAVANLQVLSELCIPFVKVKGHFIAMKGPEGHAEQTAALGAIRTLGGRPQELMEYDLVSAFDEEADESARRSIVLIKKKKKTPQAFPRRGDRIKKVPLV